MKTGYLVRSNRNFAIGVICSRWKDFYSSWGERHVFVNWLGGKGEYYPERWLEVIGETGGQGET